MKLHLFIFSSLFCLFVNAPAQAGMRLAMIIKTLSEPTATVIERAAQDWKKGSELHFPREEELFASLTQMQEVKNSILVRNEDYKDLGYECLGQGHYNAIWSHEQWPDVILRPQPALGSCNTFYGIKLAQKVVRQKKLTLMHVPAATQYDFQERLARDAGDDDLLSIIAEERMPIDKPETMLAIWRGLSEHFASKEANDNFRNNLRLILDQLLTFTQFTGYYDFSETNGPFFSPSGNSIFLIDFSISDPNNQPKYGKAESECYLRLYNYFSAPELATRIHDHYVAWQRDTDAFETAMRPYRPTSEKNIQAHTQRLADLRDQDHKNREK